MTIAELEKAIKYHQEKYYSGISEITDAEFDEMWDELKRLDPENAIFTEVFDFSNAKDLNAEEVYKQFYQFFLLHNRFLLYFHIHLQFLLKFLSFQNILL